MPFVLLLFGKFHGFLENTEVSQVVSYHNYVHFFRIKKVIYSVLSDLKVIWTAKILSLKSTIKVIYTGQKLLDGCQALVWKRSWLSNT